MSLSILRFYLCSQKYNRKVERSKNLPERFSLIVTFYIRGSKFMVFSCRKFVADGKIFYCRSTLPENVPVLFLKTVFQYLFTFASIFVLHKAG